MIRILPEEVKANEGIFKELHTCISQPEYSNIEKTMLIESIICISNYFPNQADFIKTVCDPLISSWTDQILINACSTLESFINYININSIQVVNDKQILPSAEMDILYQIASSFYIIARNTVTSKHLLANYWNSILPTAFQLIQNIQALWNVNNQQALKNKNINSYTYFLGYSEREIYHYLQQDVTNVHKTAQDILYSWIENMREMLYTIIASCMGDNPDYFYSYPNISNLMMNTCFSNIEYFETRHLITLIQTVLVPYTMLCPPKLYNQLLLPVAQIIQHSLKILELAKQKQYHTMYLPPLSEELIEIINETLVLKLSQVIVDYFSYICGNKKSGLTGKRKRINYESLEGGSKNELNEKFENIKSNSQLLIKYCFNENNIIQEIYLNGLFQLLSNSDKYYIILYISSISTRILQTINKLIPILGEHEIFCMLLFRGLINQYIFGTYNPQKLGEICNTLTIMVYWYSLGIQPPSKTPEPVKQYNKKSIVIDNIIVNELNIPSINKYY